MAYLIPTEEITLTDRKDFRNRAIEAGIRRAIALKVIGDRTQAEVREADPVTDFGCGVGGWQTMPLLVVGNQYSVFATAVPAALTPQLAVNRLAIFYKVGVETAPTPVQILQFREGVAAGSTYGWFDLEGLATKLEPEGYLSEPMVYDPQRVLNIVVVARIATLAQARVRLGCFIIEPKGPVVSA